MNNNTTEPAFAPAAPVRAEPVIADPQPVRDLALEVVESMAIQTNIIGECLAIGSDAMARYAFKELRIRGKALSKALDMLPRPIDDAGDVIGKPARVVLQ